MQSYNLIGAFIEDILPDTERKTVRKMIIRAPISELLALNVAACLNNDRNTTMKTVSPKKTASFK